MVFVNFGSYFNLKNLQCITTSSSCMLSSFARQYKEYEKDFCRECDNKKYINKNISCN